MKRGLVVKDAVTLGLARFSGERQELQELANDGWVRLENSGRLGLVKVTTSGRWLIRTIAANQHSTPGGVSSSLANLLAQALGIATATHHTAAHPPQQVRGQDQQEIG